MKRVSIIPFLLLPFLFFYSCQQGGKSGKAAAIDPDDTLPGRVVIALNPDSTPKIVNYYPVDAQGNPILGEHNREVHYYPGKKKYAEGAVKDKEKEGEWKSYFEDGVTVRSVGNYKNGELNGIYQIFHENGQKYVDGRYKEGMCDGKWSYYDQGGNLTKEFTTDENSIGCKNCPKCHGIERHNPTK
ncbi:hypothetical protein LJC68_02635 [Bacteroidales bacterium OttesenSCG-928-B11]|nr:hypothetical protein [Bacteroidales bacterium OttesenSCG-928-B11]MDL2325465.1 hypothetical protein [Bacteroidales bacterium OttesenSCG-928-A14]